jgi:hypothetical protein
MVSSREESDFTGHILPFAFFVTWGLWWFGFMTAGHRSAENAEPRSPPASDDSVDTRPRAPGCFQPLTSIGTPYRAKTYFMLVEPVAVLVGCTGGIVGEVVRRKHNATASAATLTVDETTFLSHVSVYMVFALSSFASVLDARRLIPAGVAHAVLALAFFLQGTMFGLHALMQNSPPERFFHMLSLMPFFACAVFTALELAMPRSYLTSAARAGATVLQGTWAGQMAVSLYGPAEWTLQDNDENAMSVITLYFVWHVLAVTLVLMVLYVATAGYSVDRSCRALSRCCCCCPCCAHETKAAAPRPEARFEALPDELADF